METPIEAPNTPAHTDLSMDPAGVMVWAIPLTVGLMAVVLIPHAVLYRESALTALFRAFGWWMAPALLAGIVVHELLHGVTMVVAGRLGWRDMKIGVNWRVLMPYAHPRKPIAAWAYAVGAAMPGILLGVVPASIGIATGAGPWSGWGALFLSAAAGDIMVLYTLRLTPARVLVQDHPVRVGCAIVGDIHG